MAFCCFLSHKDRQWERAGLAKENQDAENRRRKVNAGHTKVMNQQAV